VEGLWDKATPNKWYEACWPDFLITIALFDPSSMQFGTLDD